MDATQNSGSMKWCSYSQQQSDRERVRVPPIAEYEYESLDSLAYGLPLNENDPHQYQKRAEPKAVLPSG